MLNEQKLKFIQELKELREVRGLTYQQIADATETNGEPVSLSTIKHVFSDKYSHDHSWEAVLRPIANVLMPPSEDDDLETKALQTRIELNKEIIKQLQDRLKHEKENHKSREQFLIEQIDFYKEQIKNKDEELRFRAKQIKRYEENIDRKDAELRRLYTERE
jgi:transcriptional regulator with XRE-family HTH domain